MIFTATVAKKFKKVFDNTSTKMLMRCLKFLFATTNGAGDICALIKGTKDNLPEANLETSNQQGSSVTLVTLTITKSSIT